MAARDFLRNNWPAITIAVTAVAIACAAVAMLRGMPPRVTVIATGAEAGAYYEFGKRYRTELAGANVEVRVVPTAGSVETVILGPPDHVQDVCDTLGFVETDFRTGRNREYLYALDLAEMKMPELLKNPDISVRLATKEDQTIGQ